jgi:serine/threonine-protein kinase
VLVGRYRVEREIGRGGMATVYLARDSRHDRPVAFKVFNPELGAVLGIERFLAEIRVTANLQHPNLLPLFDSGEANGLLFYVMPFVEGESLRARLTREKQLPVNEAIRIATSIASAVDYAHRHGVIHRDLKPENVLLHEGQPLVADFGIALAVTNAGGARVTQTGLSLGTPHYMSPSRRPEIVRSTAAPTSTRSPAVLYEMLTGEPPHSGTTAQAVIARVLTDRPRLIRASRPLVPEYVEWAVDHALEKPSADRFATANEFAIALAASPATEDASRQRLTQSANIPVATAKSPRSRASQTASWLGLAVAALFVGAIADRVLAHRTNDTTASIEFLIEPPSLDGAKGW